MAQFPALSPSAAPITFGAAPVTTTSSLSGSESRIRHGTAEIGRRLHLTFKNVSESDFLAILSHYREQRGGFDSFGFSTTTLAAALTPSGYAWLYASPPQVVDEHADVFTVACEFKAEPRGLVVAPGDTWRSFFSAFTPGARNGGITYGASAAWVTSSTTFRPQGDGYFSNVSLLLHFDGSNGSTTFTDSSVNANTVTAFGDASLSTARKRFGTASGSFDGSGDYLTCPTTPGGLFDFGNGDFTVQASIYTTTVSVIQQVAGVWPGDYTASWRFLVVGDSIQFIGWVGYSVTISSGSCITTNTWLDIAAKKVGSTLTLYCNGTQVGSGSFSTTSGNASGAVLDIGRQQDGVGGNTWFFNGNIDELRITKGVGRDIAALTGPFPNT